VKVIPLLLLVVLLLAILSSPSYPQTEFRVQCDRGLCVIREQDLVRIQQIIEALVARIEELQARSGCS